MFPPFFDTMSLPQVCGFLPWLPKSFHRPTYSFSNQTEPPKGNLSLFIRLATPLFTSLTMPLFPTARLIIVICSTRPSSQMNLHKIEKTIDLRPHLAPLHGWHEVTKWLD
jgi:hypothetical protein